MTRWQFSKASKQAATMSTIDAGSGPLDVDALARLANQYFSEWSGSAAQTPDLTPQSFGFDSRWASAAPGTIELPGEAALRALLEPLRSVLSAAPADPMAQPLEAARVPFDVNQIRRDFPILNERVNGRQLVWLDNAATTQKPQAVIGRLKYFYEHENSNVHRAAHELAARSTDAYEGAREKVRRFLNASSARECIFVRGATEAINLVAQSWGRQNVGKDDEIVLTLLEHHANIVPWQQLAAEKGARLRVAPVDDNGQVLLHEFGKLLCSKTKLVSFAQVSNALGTITP